MSNSQQRSTNSNNNQSQIPTNNPLNDYEDDPSMLSFHNLTISAQSSFLPGNNYLDPINQIYSNEYDDDDDDIPSDIENELNTREDMMGNDQINYNYEDDAIFSDAVQNAFANYENEFSKHWTSDKPNWNNLTEEEQEEMFDQMAECLQFMPEEYPTDEIPNYLTESTHGSILNPDACEFRPSWLTTPASTESETRTVTSSAPYEIEEQKGQQKS